MTSEPGIASPRSEEQALPMSPQGNIVAAKIARAMALGPRHITKDATITEMARDGSLIVLFRSVRTG